jgi:hypothetical protein
VSGSKTLFSAVSIIPNKRQTIEAGLWKQSIHHELYFVFCFILMLWLGVQI